MNVFVVCNVFALKYENWICEVTKQLLFDLNFSRNEIEKEREMNKYKPEQEQIWSIWCRA